ncbi:MAG: hypothetical protein D6748_02735 [Calditrichaeota bacterium]|nr:MAG: hypothetical protein D6748_02735 [Calditrichota bacterium]
MVSYPVLLGVTLLVMVGMGCNHKTNIPTASDENFQEFYPIKIAEITIPNFKQVEIPEEKLAVKMDSVLNDSRCPEGAECIWEGNGKVQITVQKKNFKPESFELNTTLKPQVVFYEDYAIKLVSLTPYPKLNQTIKQEDYRVSLAIYKRE